MRLRSSCVLERLENRLFLSGNVTAWIHMGDLYVTGDHLANDLVITQVGGGNGQVSVASGSNTTTINGSDRPFVTETLSPGFDLICNMGQGPDRLKILRTHITGDLVVQTGLGIDHVILDAMGVDGDSSISTGVRPDRILIDDSNFGGEFLVDTKGGRDAIHIEQGGAEDGPHTVFNDAVEILMGNGGDEINIGMPTLEGRTAEFKSTAYFSGGRDFDSIHAGNNIWSTQPLVQLFEIDALNPLA